MSARHRPVTGSGKRALVAFAMGAVMTPSLLAGPAFAQPVDPSENACPAGIEDAGFPDIEDLPADLQEAINCIAAYGITQGEVSGNYNATGTVSRAQMALFFSRIAQYAVDNGVELELDATDAGFTDLDGVSSQTQDAINILANLGVVQGKGDGSVYDPTGRITRAQMASFIARFHDALGAPLAGEGEDVPDAFMDDEGSVHEDNINLVAYAGIAAGKTATMFDPAGSTTRGQMARFLARALEVAVSAGAIPAIDEVVDEPEVTIGAGTITAGGEVTGTLANLPEGATVTVSGAGLTNQTVTVGADGAFTITLPANAPTGAQTLSFAITVDGETVTVTANVTVAAPASITARPDLLGASVVRTVAPSEVSPGNPAGTTVRYTFDENVTAAAFSAGGAAGNFQVVLGTATTALTNGTFVAASGATVDVLFPTITAATGTGSAEELTLATVAFGAVTDATGLGNPEFDAPLGTASGGGTVTLPAGITDGPDLVSVGGFRQGSTAGTTAVDFTFDEAAYVTAAGGTFTLIPADGSAPIAATATPTPFVQGSGSDPSGGTIAGGNGTTTLTVIFPTPGSAADRPPIAATSIARAVVEAQTVSDAVQTSTPGIETGNANVLQAAQSGGQRTTDPDLVSITLVPSTTGGTDAAVFTFDEAIDPATVSTLSGFTLYTADGSTSTLGSSGQVNTQNQAQVLVTVTSGVANVVGGSVAANAVSTPVVPPTTTNPGSAARANEADEQGVANSTTGAARTPGRTGAPDLTGVAISRAASPFPGSTGALQVTYTFDVDVALPANNAGNANEFLVYLSDGTRLRGTVISTATRTEDADNTVTVTGFEALLADNVTVRTAAVTEAELESAVLGTVAATAVASETGAIVNFPAAERTTGSTGTPAS